jgi:hypothetical protein
MSKLPDPTKPSTRAADKVRVTRDPSAELDDPTKISTSSTPNPEQDEADTPSKEREAESSRSDSAPQ